MGNSRESLRDQLLVVSCQAGDDHAFEQLVVQYHASLLRYLSRLAGSESARDLLQEVWFDAYRNVAKLREPAPFCPRPTDDP